MADAILKHPCPGCKSVVLTFDLFDEKPILCPHCKMLVSHPGAGGTNPAIEIMRSLDRSNTAYNDLALQMLAGGHPGHDFIGIEQMSSEELSKATVSIVKECFKRMNLLHEDWPLRLNSILDLLGIGNVVLPPGTAERHEKLRKLLDYD